MRRLAPLGWAVVAWVIHGYRFGTTDQAVQLTLVWSWVEPGRLAGDLVASHASHHPSLLWPLTAAVVQLLGWQSLPGVAALAWVLALLGWLAGVQALAEALWPGRWSWLAPGLVVGWAWLPGHHQLFAAEAVARTLAAPWLLWAVVWGIRQRWGAAAACLMPGLLLHGTTGTQALTVLWALAWWSGRWREAGVLLLPLLGVLWLGWHAPSGWMDERWWNIVRWRLGHHVAPGTWPLSWWAVVGLQGGLAWAAVRATPRLAPLVWVGLTWAVVATLASAGLRWAPLVTSHGWYGWSWIALAGAVGLWPRLRPLPRPLGLGLGLLVSVQVPSSWLGVERSRATSVGWPEATGGEHPASVPWKRVVEGVPVDVSVKDGGEVAFSRELALEWAGRLEARCGPLPLTELEEPRGYVRARRFAESYCDPTASPDRAGEGDQGG